MTTLKVITKSRIELVDITAQARRAVESAGVANGLCNLFVTHTTAGLMVSENWDPDLTGDILGRLERLVPHEAGYRHSEGNAQSHILSVMLGVSVNIPVRNGTLALGRWQGVILTELDGPRERSVIVTVIAGA